MSDTTIGTAPVPTNSLQNLLDHDIVVSFDVETDGLLPGTNSIRQIGAVAYRGGVEISSFDSPMARLASRRPDPSTLAFWQRTDPARWDKLDSCEEPAAKVMARFVRWLHQIEQNDGDPRPLVLVGNPGAFDFAWLLDYARISHLHRPLMAILRRNRIIDIRSLIHLHFLTPYSVAERSLCPPEWAEGLQITHDALDDARQQAAIYFNLIKQACARRALFDTIPVLQNGGHPAARQTGGPAPTLSEDQKKAVCQEFQQLEETCQRWLSGIEPYKHDEFNYNQGKAEGIWNVFMAIQIRRLLISGKDFFEGLF